MESTERPIPLPSASPSSPDQLPHNCTVTSASTAFDSTNVSGTSSPTSQTSALAGNPAFYQGIVSLPHSLLAPGRYIRGDGVFRV